MLTADCVRMIIKDGKERDGMGREGKIRDGKEVGYFEIFIEKFR